MIPEKCDPVEVRAECTRCNVLVTGQQIRVWTQFDSVVSWGWQVYGLCALCQLTEMAEEAGEYDSEDCED